MTMELLSWEALRCERFHLSGPTEMIAQLHWFVYLLVNTALPPCQQHTPISQRYRPNISTSLQFCRQLRPP